MNGVIVIFAVSDPTASARIYSEVFGFVVQVDAPNYVELRMTQGSSLGLYQKEGFPRNFGGRIAPKAAGAAQPAELYVRVPDASAVIGALEAHGWALQSALAERPWGERVAYFLDPDGFVVAVAEIP